jgi:hypothetical protein
MKHILALVLVLSASCVKVQGNLKVDEHVLYNKNGRSKVLLAGDYKANVTIKKEELKLKLKGNLENHRLTLKFPKGTVLPSTNGEISVSAQDLKQPFALAGNVKTDVTRSELVTTTERCSINVGMYDCDWGGGYYDGRGGYYGPYSYCHGRVLDGERDVRYFNDTTTRTLSLQLLQEESSKATFTGVDVDVKRVYQFRGVCHL